MPGQVINQLTFHLWYHLFSPVLLGKEEHLKNPTPRSLLLECGQQEEDVCSFPRKRKVRKPKPLGPCPPCVPPRAGGFAGTSSSSVRGLVCYWSLDIRGGAILGPCQSNSGGGDPGLHFVSYLLRDNLPLSTHTPTDLIRSDKRNC